MTVEERKKRENDLTARSLHRYEGYNICDRCHESIFINKTYGPAEGAMTVEERKKREEEERLARERAEKAKRDRLCPECDKKTFENDSEMLAPDLYYHRGWQGRGPRKPRGTDSVQSVTRRHSRMTVKCWHRTYTIAEKAKRDRLCPECDKK